MSIVFGLQSQQVSASQALWPSLIHPIGEHPWTQSQWTSLRGYPCLMGMTHSGGSVPTDQDGTVHSHLHDIDAEDLAHILSQVFAKHSTLTDIISDWGKHFISRFWRSLYQLLGIKANLSTAYHQRQMGKLNGSTRSWNSTFGCISTTNRMIGSTSFPGQVVYNNTLHSVTMVTPFFANKGFHPKLEVSLKSVCWTLLTKLLQ